MSEPRKCQFFLRGRCQREKCEFSHVMPSNLSSSATANGSKVLPPANTSISMVGAFARGKAPFITKKVTYCSIISSIEIGISV